MYSKVADAIAVAKGADVIVGTNVFVTIGVDVDVAGISVDVDSEVTVGVTTLIPSQALAVTQIKDSRIERTMRCIDENLGYLLIDVSTQKILF